VKHEDIGRLMAYLDGELPRGDAASVEAHVGRCAACADALQTLRAEASHLRVALATLDRDAAAAVGAAGERIRARLAATTGPLPRHQAPVPPSAPPPRWRLRSRALQAAALVLLMAGGVSALVIPGSPLRHWLGGGPAVEKAAAPTADAAAFPEPEEELPQVGVRTASSGGRIRIALELPSGTSLRVTLVQGETAAVFAPQGAGFRQADGLLEASATSGPVHVEVPLGSEDASLVVGERLYLSVREGRAEVGVPAESRSGTEILFRVP